MVKQRQWGSARTNRFFTSAVVDITDPLAHGSLPLISMHPAGYLRNANSPETQQANKHFLAPGVAAGIPTKYSIRVFATLLSQEGCPLAGPSHSLSCLSCRHEIVSMLSYPLGHICRRGMPPGIFQVRMLFFCERALCKHL